MPTHTRPLRHVPVRPLLGLLLIALNLRAAITVVAPLLTELAADFVLGTTVLGVLTATPILLFALASPLATWLARHKGLEKAFVLALGCLGTGLLLRSSGSLAALFGGTVLIAVGIAIGNVLLPSLVKRDFAQNPGTLTSVYAVFIGISAALGGALAVPLAHLSSWPAALASPLVLVVMAMIFWLPRYRYSQGLGSINTGSINTDSANVNAPGAPTFTRPVWRYALAWQVTLFMGLNAFVFFLIIGWLPAMLQAAGYSARQAGALHGLMLLFGAFPALLLMPLFRYLRDQRLMTLAISLGLFAGYWGLWQLPAQGALWSALLGLAAGSGFVASLSLITLRTRNPLQATQLSGMVQCLGYLTACAGLLLTGWMHDLSGNWSGVLMLAMGCCACMGVLGWLAGRSRFVQ